MKKTVIILLTAIILAGCSSGKKSTVICEFTGDDASYVDTLVSKGDKVATSTLVAVSDYAAEISEGEYTEEDLEVGHELNKAGYANLDGVKYEYVINGTIVTETLSFDYGKTSLKELYDADILDIPNADFISLSETQKSYEQEGFTCSVK